MRLRRQAKASDVRAASSGLASAPSDVVHSDGVGCTPSDGPCQAAPHPADDRPARLLQRLRS